MSATRNYSRLIRHSVYYFTIALLTIACGGGDKNTNDGTGGAGNPVVSNADFLAKVKAVSLNQITLYPGYLNDTSLLRPNNELLAGDVASGTLISIDVSFILASGISDYSLNAYLVPQSIYSQFNTGSTIGGLFSEAAAAVKDENIIDLGAAYIAQVSTGDMSAIIHAKLPVLKTTNTFKIAVMPSIGYLAAGKAFADKDIEAMPVLLDDTEIVIKPLDQITAEVVNLPNLVADNEFTDLEQNASFDKNGFSVEPIFQSSVNINLNTFNDQEVVVLALNWTHPKSKIVYPLGLLSTNTGTTTPLVAAEARFVVKKQLDSSTMTVPISAHVSSSLYSVLLRLSTNIQDIADQTPATGTFSLNVATVDVNNTTTAGINYNLNIPLVKQAVRVYESLATDYTQYTVLRAGSLNLGCLGIQVIEGIPVPVDSMQSIASRNCASLSDEIRWRYDPITQQFLFKIKDPNNDQYCLHALASLDGTAQLELRKCAYEPSSPGKPVFSQKFVFKNNNLLLGGVLYLIFDTATEIANVTSVQSEGSTFFRDANGLDVDANGRVFSAGKSYNNSWGDVDIAQVSLAFGGESFVDYLPVIGAEASGQVNLSASMLGQGKELINATFDAKRYLDKKLSIAANNYPDKMVGDGMELIIDVAGKSSIKLGSITPKNVTNSFSPGTDSPIAMLSQVPIPVDIKPATSELTYKMDQTFIDVTFVVATVPVTIEGGVSGELSFKVALAATGGVGTVGLTASAQEILSLNAYLLGKFDAGIVSGALTANLELVNQNITFSTTHGFSANANNSINYFMDASLTGTLKVLQGKLSGYVDYPVPSCCYPPWKTVRKDFTIYSTDYLYNKQWSIFSLNVTSTELMM